MDPVLRDAAPQHTASSKVELKQNTLNPQPHL